MWLFALCVGSSGSVLALPFAYTTNGTFGTVSAFSLSASTGALTLLPGSTVTTGGAPSDIAVTPNGAFAYVVPFWGYTATVSAFSINAATGALTPVPGSPFATDVDPSYVTVTDTGPFPAAKGELGTGVRAPVMASMLSTETLSEPLFATKANAPFGATVTSPTPDPPVAKGEPGTGVRAPVMASMAKPDTLAAPRFVT